MRMTKLSENSPDWVESLEIVPKARHLCWLYEADEERLTIVNEFLGEALARKKQCLLVLTEDIKKQILERLKEQNLNVGQYLLTEQIIALEPDDLFFSENGWDIDLLVSRLGDVFKTAKKKGWEGLAVVSDASDSIERASDEDWAAWEFHADFECYTRRCTMLCLYDLRKISSLSQSKCR